VPVPEPHRTRTVDRRGALQMLRCPEGTLDWLVDEGLPCSLDDGEQSFERRDLFNLGLYSGSGRTLAELVTRYLGRLAADGRSTWSDTRGWRAQVVLSCPRAGECGPDVTWELARPRPAAFGGRLNRVTAPSAATETDAAVCAREPRGSFTVLVALVSNGRERTIASRALREAYRSLFTDYRFQILAEGVKTDLDWIERTRVSDCDGLSAILARECEREGHEAQLERGLMLGQFGFGHHTWVRVRDADGEWKVLDPTLPVVAALGTADDIEPFRDFCCGSWLNRVLPCAAHGEPLADHLCGDDHVAPDVSLRVRRDEAQVAQE
jgi:hypothetical protein